jgi:outer membrane protein assembly factor BamB
MAERTIDDLIFVGFNSRIFALDRYTGELAWHWKSPRGSSSHVALLLDGDRLIASVNGYMYCLDPLFGQVVWANELKGFGTGVAALTSARGQAVSGAAATLIAAQQAAAAHTATGAAAT